MKSLGFSWISGRLWDGGLGHKSGAGVNAPVLQKAGGEASARQRQAAVRDPHKAVLDHGVAAAMLGGVQRGVRGLDQVARALRVVRPGAGDADADGDGFI